MLYEEMGLTLLSGKHVWFLISRLSVICEFESQQNSDVSLNKKVFPHFSLFALIVMYWFIPGMTSSIK